MSEEEIEKQLKKSRRQRKDERYEYINSHFNQTNYAMNLEKHALKLHSQNAQLKERVDMYENPEDLTLMFMYCDEKAKDKIKHLTSALKEIRDYIKSNISYEKNSDGIGEPYLGGYEIRDLLEIIDKVKID